MDSYEIIDFIANSEKKTPVKIFIKGNFTDTTFKNFEYYGNLNSGILFTDYKSFTDFYEDNNELIESYRIEADRKNSAIELADYSKINARIEPGAIIRDMTEIKDGAVIMMGAVINIGAVVGEKTMIDMNAVVGGRALIGKNCHIGAGAVIAGVIEPASAQPVIIEDNVLVGANAVVLEGIKVGKGSVVAAGAIVVENVPENCVVAGSPAKIIKKVDEKTLSKTALIEELRKL
ncbi:MAG: 2,3,4,5-tetrahydropyridine-2,6-dicarboxylate N-acetyltransferase [Thermotogae bacterium]|nr:2,3,4,5-tetrahydropyridine-2,6-dicarboxylate N-acetyltransferase [Thermotogota bacterium]HOO75399.1 2,3,4,5-tetrahydropyridine-2,6-dicarboxylate N-acetyltransferase [Tepiditoga sp.]